MRKIVLLAGSPLSLNFSFVTIFNKKVEKIIKKGEEKYETF